MREDAEHVAALERGSTAPEQGRGRPGVGTVTSSLPAFRPGPPPSGEQVVARPTAQARCVAVLLLVAAAAHVPLIPDHLHEAPYVGRLFIVLSAVYVALAVLVVLVGRPWVWVASGVICLAAVIAFLLSRTVGLPQLEDDVGNWTEPLGFPAVASEVLVALVAWIHLTTSGRATTSTDA